MNELNKKIDEIVDNLVAEAVEKAITEWAGQEYPNDATFYDVTVKQAKQAIIDLTAEQVRLGRIDELEKIHTHINRSLGNYHEYEKRLAQLKQGGSND